MIHNRVTEFVLDCHAAVRLLLGDKLMTIKLKEAGVRTLEKVDTTVVCISKLGVLQLYGR